MAVLVLEDGRTFHGESFGAEGEAFGEAVFATGMTGYQETLTDPSYHRQIVVQTAPHIGNTGVNEEDAESSRIWVSGYVVRDPAPRPSSWRATASLADELVAQGVVGISGVDTRALTRHLRERGAMRCAISSVDPAGLHDRVLASPAMSDADLSAAVTTTEPYVVQADRRVALHRGGAGLRHQGDDAVPDGAAGHHLPRAALPRGCGRHPGHRRGRRLPLERTGRPGHRRPRGVARLVGRGHADLRDLFRQPAARRAYGFGTYKLGYGHRGINQPVQDRATGKVEVTAHNHGFAVDAPIDRVTETEFGAVEVSHVGLNDDVVEGLRALDVPAFSVQYHPEAAAGPHDADYLFDRFAEMLEGERS